jgi:LPXTG-motif cell wall-anchored protein
MHRSNASLLAGLIVFVAGAAGFTYGLFMYNNQKPSIGNVLQKIFNGSSTEEQTAVIFMIAGGAVALIGLLLVIFRGRRR